MQRRIIAAFAAVVLAGIGAVLLYTYVNNADARAMAGLEPAGVLVATQPIPAGTRSSDLAPYVELTQLPSVAVVPGALTDTSSVVDLVTNTEIGVGEQLLSTRFIEPNTTTTGEVEVPADLQQFTIQLAPNRVIGTKLAPGDKIALFVSKEENQVAMTKLAYREVLVTRIQGATTGEDENGETAPSGEVLITLALTPKAAAEVIWGAEFGTIWMALEPSEGDLDSTTIVKVKDIFG